MTIALHSEGGESVSINHLHVEKQGVVLLLLLRAPRACRFDRFPPLLACPAGLQWKNVFLISQIDVIYTRTEVCAIGRG